MTTLERTRYAERLVNIDMPFFGGAPCADIAQASGKPDHPFNKLMTIQCHGRPIPSGLSEEDEKKMVPYGGYRVPCPDQAQLEVPGLLAAFICCDKCRDLGLKEQSLAKARSYWEAICPASLRDTNKDHPGFPKAQYAATMSYTGAHSLLLYGDTRTGKTRLGMWLIKRCLVMFGMHVGVMWPEQLKAMKKTFTPLEELNKWARFDLLLMDDALLAGAMDSRLTDWLKDLIDLRMRHNKPMIITSQIGGAEYKDQSNKFAEATGADKKMIDALCGRISETFTVVPFVSVKPSTETKEEMF